MARTQSADYERKRELIVEKAAELFARAGFRGVSVSELATACETSKSLIYHYYPSKEDILYAVMASHIDQLAGDVAEVGREDGDARGKLHQLVHLFMSHYVGATDRQKVLLNDLDQLPDEKRRVIVRQQRAIIDAVTGLFGKMEPELASDPVAARARAMMLFGMINWTHTWYDASGPIKPDEIAELAYHLATRSTQAP